MRFGFFGLWASTRTRSAASGSGQAAAKEKGITWGGKPQGVYFKVTPDQENTIVKLVGNGEKVARVARITGLSRPTIYRVLRNHEPVASRPSRAFTEARQFGPPDI